MYKRTATAAHSISRTGSYSLKPHAGGRVDILPVGASENLYGAFRERRSALIERVHRAENAMTELRKENESLHRLFTQYDRDVKHALDRGLRAPNKPFRLAEYERKFKEAKRELSVAKNDLESLNKAADLKKIKQLEWAELFVRVAEQLLDEVAFARIKDEVRRRFALSRERG